MARRIAFLVVLLAFLFPVLLLSAKAQVGVYQNPIGDSWAVKASMHQARIGLGAAAVNGKIYAIGGLGDVAGGGYYSLGINEEYDPVSDIWTYKAPMPTPRIFFGIAVYQNKIYCIGGIASTGSSATGINEVYDPARDTWQTLSSMPTPRMGIEANVANDRIYLIGGQVSDQTGTVLGINEEYDPLTDTWKTKTSMPNIASSFSAVVDNKIYVIGSLNQIYNPENDNWSLGAPPTSVGLHSGVGVTSGIFAPKRIYLFGEKSQSYNPESDHWSNSAPIPTARNYPGVAAVNEKFYIIGGFIIERAENPSSQWILDFNPQEVYTALNEEYTPVDYGTVPPEIFVLSPENSMSYNSRIVSLNFTVNKPTDWLGYSLDRQEYVTISGNTTISNLPSGLHNVTVYANDAYGNVGTSETVAFTIDQSTSLTTTVAAVTTITAVAGVTVGLAYLKKRKHNPSEAPREA